MFMSLNFKGLCFKCFVFRGLVFRGLWHKGLGATHVVLAVLFTALHMQPLAAQSTAASKAYVGYVGIGRAATPAEVAAWDIDVRPDFKGLPKGRGSVAQGQELWEAKCESCHGVFGESNAVFNPIIGGTTAKDIETGQVANLKQEYPGRTTMMKLSQISTLWDYINRAMPWTTPKSLKPDEVYALTAYILNLGGVVGADFVLSNENMAMAQNRLPNRNGMTTEHALWPGTEFRKKKTQAKPDVIAQACMKNCATNAKVDSILPDYARNAHGNLAEQNRLVGPQRGADTLRPESANPVRQVFGAASSSIVSGSAPTEGQAVKRLLQQNNCTACHAQNAAMVGPSFKSIAQKHADKTEYLAGKIRSGGVGVWGSIPMPAQTLPEADLKRIAQWLALGAQP
jgi:S-disulfanyl-L-cysteine oxidoreductase SoxD